MEVTNYEDYKVLSNGQVIGTRGKVLKVDLNSVGYERVTLSKEGVTKRVTVHRLVAEHYCPNPHNLPHVNHINGNRRDNRAENLEWCTPSYNIKDGWHRGRRSHNRLPQEVEDAIYQDVLEGKMLIKDIAAKYGIHRGTVTEIRKREESATTIPKGSTAKRLEAVPTER